MNDFGLPEHDYAIYKVDKAEFENLLLKDVV